MRNHQKNEKGFILFYTLIVVGLISLIAETSFLVTTNDLKTAARTANSIRAYYVADAGLADAFMQLRAAATAPATLSASSSSYSVGSGSGSYSVTATSDGASWPTYTIVSQGTYKGAARTLTLKVKMTSFSRWGYLSNTEIDPVWGGNWFITGMISTGPTHTNGQFNMWGAPVFGGAVSQVNPAVNYWSPSTDNPDYQQGLTVNAPALSMPAAATFLNTIKGGAQQASGLLLTGDSTITLVSDGTMNVTNAANGWTNHNMAIPSNGALYVQSGNATVQGVLKGQLTIASDAHIYIGGNLIYNSNPRTDPTSTDMLGLVAYNNVYVTDHGPQNIEVDGSIAALTGQFQVQNFWTFLKGDMIQYGGLTTNLPGGLTGIFNPSNGQMIAGYNQLQYFDERLKNQAPLWFPPVTDSSGRITYSKISFYET